MEKNEKEMTEAEFLMTYQYQEPLKLPTKDAYFKGNFVND